MYTVYVVQHIRLSFPLRPELRHVHIHIICLIIIAIMPESQARNVYLMKSHEESCVLWRPHLNRLFFSYRHVVAQIYDLPHLRATETGRRAHATRCSNKRGPSNEFYVWAKCSWKHKLLQFPNTLAPRWHHKYRWKQRARVWYLQRGTHPVDYRQRHYSRHYIICHTYDMISLTVCITTTTAHPQNEKHSAKITLCTQLRHVVAFVSPTCGFR